LTYNLATTTQPSIEDKYDEEFTLLVELFYMDVETNSDFTDDEYHEALTEALNKRKENNIGA
jgi:hypothetical protein